jgi:hypothetical protein
VKEDAVGMRTRVILREEGETQSRPIKVHPARQTVQ